MTRREILRTMGGGFGMAGFAGLLSHAVAAETPAAYAGPLAPKSPHFPA